jgi:hydroxypyruvate reductase
MRLSPRLPPAATPEARSILLDVLEAALRRVDGRTAVANFLRAHTQFMASPRVVVIAIGKAAAAMAQGALEVARARVVRALVVTKAEHAEDLRSVERVTVVESAHPVPDERSLQAGSAVLAQVHSLAADEFPLLLISGGASSLVESLRPGVTLDELIELNRRGLASGWSIEQLNAERARLSSLKGGGLTHALAGRPALALFISDVPADDPNVIGSGLAGTQIGVADRVERHIVASLDYALDAVRAAAEAHGLEATVRTAHFADSTHAVAREFCSVLRNTQHELLAWGGESVVSLPPAPGRGGRNQHLALECAMLLRDAPSTYVMAVGTDGSDGLTTDAGALIDAETCERIELAGFDPQIALDGADSGTVLEAAGDLIHTGPTGTNVCDLLIGLRYGSARSARHE